jgi:hypothetical protein
MIENIEGRRYGKLIVLEAFRKNEGSWLRCQCDCGKVFDARRSNVLRGNTKSCGCLRRENTAKLKFKHGQACEGHRSLTYKAWKSMIRRCEQPNPKRSPYYLKNQIKVCDEWRNSFEKFLADMGQRPSPDHSPDRIDNTKGYFPGNVRWATKEEQRMNTSNHFWKHGVETSVCQKCGIKVRTKTIRGGGMGPCTGKGVV